MDLLKPQVRNAQELGRGRVSATIGSALDIFGGSLPYADVVAWSKTRSVDTAGFAAS